MKLLSSKIVRYKWAAPVLTTLLISAYIFNLITDRFGVESFAGFLIPCIVILINYVYMKILSGDFVDVFYDENIGLIINKKRDQDRFSFSKVEKLTLILNKKPKQATLHLTELRKFGEDVSFVLPMFSSSNIKQNNIVKLFKSESISITSVEKCY